MNKIITQFKDSFVAISVVAVISLISTNSANAGFLDFAKDSVSYGISYVTPDTAQTEPVSAPVKQIEVKTRVIRTHKVIVSAYNSEKGQTDDSPCITASGYNVCEANIENIIAANFLPLHTKVKISGFNGIFTVEDRMNRRYTDPKDGYNFMDIWMKDKSDALKFGRQRLVIEVIALDINR